MTKLITTYDVLEEHDKTLYEGQVDVVNAIVSNLAIQPRPYQIKALNRMIHYYENHINKDFNIHLLFQLATGSGKTLLMAMMMLYLRSKGYSAFIFLVDSIAIVDKTKLNFTTLNSSKRLFKSTINLNGESIEVKDVSTITSDKNINVYYTTIQALHTALSNPTETNMDVNDYKALKSPIVLLADEAHHLNTSTKKDSDKASWEGTITQILGAKKGNILLEMTATPETNIKAVDEKYEDKLITSYPLSEFTKDGYAKSILVHHSTNLSIQDKMLEAILFSQYRKHLASSMNIILKPVILFKSSTIKASEANQKTFTELVENLTVSQLESITELLSKSGLKDYYPNIHADFIEFLRRPMNILISDIQREFSVHNVININDNDALQQNSVRINTLEENNNPYRVIFEVKRLDEGWDVLNLFDIVKLFTTKNKSNNTKEVQLIGRGARYNPFIDPTIPEAEQNKYKQKYPVSEDNPKRMLESLLFHSDDTPDFINTLSETLKNMGHNIVVKYKTETINLKKEFMEDVGYTTKGIYLNNRINVVNVIENVGVAPYRDKTKKKDIEYVKISPDELRKLEIEYEIGSTSTITSTEEKLIETSKKYIDYKFEELVSYQIFIKACNKTTPVITSEYLTKVCASNKRKDLYEHVLTGTSIRVRSERGERPAEEGLLEIAVRMLKAFVSSVNKLVVSKNGRKGTKEFTETPIKDLLPLAHDIRVKVDKEAISASILAQDKIFCDSKDEEDFVKFMEDTIKNDADFDKKFDYFYLVRNNLYFKLFSKETGEAFYPDFVILAKKGKDYQLFSEVKGEHLIQFDAWKEVLLEEIHEQVDNTMLIGLKFYTKANKKEYAEELTKRIV